MNEYVKAFKNFANFEGRASRKEYWMFFLFNLIISYGLQILGVAMKMSFLSILGIIYSFVALLPSIAVAIRRMHDVDKSGWFCLIPFYNLILAATAGTPGPNQYGQDPYGNLDLDLEKGIEHK